MKRMIINNFDLSKDEDFLIFSKQIIDDFVAFKISSCKNLSIFDSLLKYAELKEIDEDLLGDCIKNDFMIRELILKELNKDTFTEISDW